MIAATDMNGISQAFLVPLAASCFKTSSREGRPLTVPTKTLASLFERACCMARYMLLPGWCVPSPTSSTASSGLRPRADWRSWPRPPFPHLPGLPAGEDPGGFPEALWQALKGMGYGGQVFVFLAGDGMQRLNRHPGKSVIVILARPRPENPATAPPGQPVRMILEV